MGGHDGAVVAGYSDTRVAGVVAATLELIENTDFNTG